MSGYSDDQDVDATMEELVEEIVEEQIVEDVEAAQEAGVTDSELSKIFQDADAAFQESMQGDGDYLSALQAGLEVLEREIAETERRRGLEVTTDA